jgi:tetratricopeptide (TPR) repeat protein
MNNRFAEAEAQYESLLRLRLNSTSDTSTWERLSGNWPSRRGSARIPNARQLDTSSVDPLIHLGEIYILRGEWAFAAEASVNAIRRSAKNPQPFFYLGLSLYCNGMPDLAKDSLWRAVDMDPKLGQARLLLANIYLNERDDRSALSNFDLYFSKGISKSGLPACPSCALN